MMMLEHRGCWGQLDVPCPARVKLARLQAQLYEYIYPMELKTHQARGADGAASEGNGKKKDGRWRGGGPPPLRH